MNGVPLPSELAKCQPRTLEAYVQARLLDFLDQPGLSSVVEPFREVLQAAAVQYTEGGTANRRSRSTELVLAFKHDCQHIGCADPHCILCSQNQQRRCSRPFQTKYLSGDVIRAGCGAVIRVELVDKATQKAVDVPELAGCLLEMLVLDGRALEGLSGVALSDQELERIALPFNPQGSPLLAARQAEHSPKGAVVTPFTNSAAMLPDLYVAGSSEAMLSGQKPPFVLMVRLLDAQGQRVAAVRPLLSDGFVVATPRVRTAAKKAIPHLDDHVSKLNAVGNATQTKLKDLRKAASDAGSRELELPFNSISKVREFRELVVWAEAEPKRLDSVRKMLKLTKGWEEAREHALKAVGTDNRLRVWYASPSLDKGLLFGCEGAVPAFDQPLALLGRAFSSGAPTLQATVLVMMSGNAPNEVPELLEQAKASWTRRGHPGWAAMNMDTSYFLQACSHLPTVMLPPPLVSECIPQCLTRTTILSASGELLTVPAGAGVSPAISAGTGGRASPMLPGFPVFLGEGSRGRQGAASPQLPGAAQQAQQGLGFPGQQCAAAMDLELPPRREGTPPEQQEIRQRFAGLGVASTPPSTPGTPGTPLAGAAAAPGAAFASPITPNPSGGTGHNPAGLGAAVPAMHAAAGPPVLHGTPIQALGQGPLAGLLRATAQRPGLLRRLSSLGGHPGAGVPPSPFQAPSSPSNSGDTNRAATAAAAGTAGTAGVGLGEAEDMPSLGLDLGLTASGGGRGGQASFGGLPSLLASFPAAATNPSMLAAALMTMPSFDSLLEGLEQAEAEGKELLLPVAGGGGGAEGPRREPVLGEAVRGGLADMLISPGNSLGGAQGANPPPAAPMERPFGGSAGSRGSDELRVLQQQNRVDWKQLMREAYNATTAPGAHPGSQAPSAQPLVRPLQRTAGTAGTAQALAAGGTQQAQHASPDQPSATPATAAGTLSPVPESSGSGEVGVSGDGGSPPMAMAGACGLGASDGQQAPALAPAATPALSGAPGLRQLLSSTAELAKLGSPSAADWEALLRDVEQYGGIGIPEALPGESSMPGGGPLQRHLTPEWQKLSMSGVDWASLMQDIQQETAMLIAQQAQQGRADHSVAQRAQQAAVQDAQQAQQGQQGRLAASSPFNQASSPGGAQQAQQDPAGQASSPAAVPAAASSSPSASEGQASPTGGSGSREHGTEQGQQAQQGMTAQQRAQELQKGRRKRLLSPTTSTLMGPRSMNIDGPSP